MEQESIRLHTNSTVLDKEGKPMELPFNPDKRITGFVPQFKELYALPPTPGREE